MYYRTTTIWPSWYIALMITDTLYTSLFYAKASFQTVQAARNANIISGATFVAVAVTSITATYLICHHIYTSTKHNQRSWKRYKHIVDICIQSSIIYTTIMVFETIIDFLETDDPESASNISVQALDMYLEAFLNIASVSLNNFFYVLPYSIYMSIHLFFLPSTGPCSDAYGGSISYSHREHERWGFFRRLAVRTRIHTSADQRWWPLYGK